MDDPNPIPGPVPAIGQDPAVLQQLAEGVDQAQQPQAQDQPPPMDVNPGMAPSMQSPISAPQPPPRPMGTSSLGSYQGTKGQIFRNMLGDFLYSAGKGLAEAGHGPGANARGAGVAIGALRDRAIQDQQLALQQQQMANQTANSQAAVEGSRARAAYEQAETSRLQQITPFDIADKQLAVAVAQAQLKFFSDPEQLPAAVADVTKSLGKLSPGEKASLDAATKDAQITRKFDPINAAVKTIADQRAVTARGTEGSDYKDWRKQFIKEHNGQEPTAKDIVRFRTSGQQLTVSAANSRAEDTRLDNSYKLTTTQLAAIAKPITDRVDRLQRLQISLDERSPQADSLIAPELLTAMAGGMGSGLRMNEAEIARIVGGRTQIESLKAALNKYRLDPTKGLSITDAQRKQVYSLVNKMNEKVQGKVAVLNDAQQQLINAPDVESHRKILAETKAKLSAVDEGKDSGGGAAPARPTNVPDSAVWDETTRRWRMP